MFKTQSTHSLLALVALTAVAGCQMAPMPPDPTGRASVDMIRVLAALQTSGAKPVDTLSVAAARAQPTPGDAATSVAVQMGLPAKMPLAKVTDIQIDGAAGPLAARIYDPQASRPAPVILYFHGGGWVTGTLDTYDASDRALAMSTGAIVLSVAYRLAPENRFPPQKMMPMRRMPGC